MATRHSNINQYYDSEEDKIQFFPLESYIDSSWADYEEELDEAEEAERAGVKEIAREAGREEEAEEEIELGGVQASVGEVGAEDDNAVEERAEPGSGH